MTPEEVTAFLDRVRPALLGVVATLRADGSPHAVPVWYRWDGEGVSIWTHEERAWVQNARRDPRVAFSVQEIDPPYAAVVVRGRAEVTTSDASEIDEEIRRITRRYIDEPEVESYIADWSHLRTIVTIRPGSTSAWSRGY